jgi:hypothetical protein
MPSKRPLFLEKVRSVKETKDLRDRARKRVYAPEVNNYTKKGDAEIGGYIYKLTNLLSKRGVSVHPFVYEYFSDPRFFNSLPSLVRQNPISMLRLLATNSKFFSIIHDFNLYGQEVTIGESKTEHGASRSLEVGPRINLEYLRSKGIDPSQVLFFRITQPSYAAKPEYYWTTDFFEPLKGLRMEISPEKRKNAVLLISNLETINRNGGLIRDVNDDAGLAVRQISNANFNQNLCLSRVKISDL